MEIENVVKKKSKAGRPKGSGGPNKSLEIRKYLEKNPEASTQDVIDALKENNIEVSQALIAGVRSKGEIIEGNWVWATKARSKKSKNIEVSESDLSSLQKLIDDFNSQEEMDTTDIIDYLSDAIEKIGGYDKFKIAYNKIKMNITDSSDDDESDDNDDDTSTECSNETVTMAISDCEGYEEDEDDDD